jgi:hypothetical protein
MSNPKQKNKRGVTSSADRPKAGSRSDYSRFKERKAVDTVREATRGNKKVTASASRSARSKASEIEARKKTTSSGKGAGPKPTVDSRKTRQSNQTAKVTGSGSKASSTPSTAVVTRGQNSFAAPPQKAPSVPKPKPSAPKGGGIKGGVQAAIAGEVMRARPVADGTLKKGIDSMKLDDVLRQARKDGQKTVTWRGKSYTTKLK